MPIMLQSTTIRQLIPGKWADALPLSNRFILSSKYKPASPNITSGAHAAITGGNWPTSPIFENRVEIPTYESAIAMRSEEHTSELQSLRHLVCRVLLVSINQFV